MKHWHKVILLIFCVSSLFYFDSKEKPNVRNNNKFHVDSDIRVRFGHISVRSVCYVAVKRGRRQVKCPVCDKWVRDLQTKIYNCTNSNIKRSFIFTHRGRR
jgi:hypothetical protein